MQTQWSLPNTYYMTCCFCSAVPDYAKIQGNTTHTVSTNPITGLSDITFTSTVTSHWSSLAIVKSVFGVLTKGLATGDAVVDALEGLFTHSISLLVSAMWSIFWLCIVLRCGIDVVQVCVYVKLKLWLMCLISLPVSVVNVSWVGNCSQEYWLLEIHMSCCSGVTSHFITSAAKHDCALFPVLQS